MGERTVQLHFYNHIAQQSENNLLIFLQPTELHETDQLYPWEILHIAVGEACTIPLTTCISAEIAIFDQGRNSHGYYGQRIPLPPGQALQIQNPDGLRPFIGHPGKFLDANHVGLQNKTSHPELHLSIRWYINGKQILETHHTEETALAPNQIFNFELQPYLYLLFAPPPELDHSFTGQNLITSHTFHLPPEATHLYFEIVLRNGEESCQPISQELYEDLLQRTKKLHSPQR
ncbi:hypothetical protein [Tengunoibacter tsumagoiensis]|uniref:Uncharacterized protein n=1 Tax=Tengunoibacter tsumagoiensis TaxID=2014871 RepID=A0A402A622_9CHLR|nr:hypothetical protein [Tengunoibacter tsumagoiensis]GCE14455.1 hypothetical protein KTT_43140 [Tengunoibacter tsumagoiensis]